MLGRDILVSLCWATDDSDGDLMAWILNEDRALKLKLQGLKVTDPNAPAGGRGVKVRYRLPENELADLDFPIIIIEHSGISRDPEREHRGYIQLPYAPEGFEGWWDADDTSMDPKDSPYFTDFPVPHNIDYKVTVLTRKALHLMPIISQLAQVDRLPSRFGYLEVPEDSTVRSLFNMGGPDIGTVEYSYGKDEDGKTLHRASYAVRVPTEITELEVENIWETFLVNAVNIDLSEYSDVQDLDTKNLTESFGPVGIRRSINWATS